MKHSKAFTKLKKEIKALPDYNRGFHTNWWNGYIRGMYDHKNYGDITEQEAVELMKIICKDLEADQAF